MQHSAAQRSAKLAWRVTGCLKRRSQVAIRKPVRLSLQSFDRNCQVTDGSSNEATVSDLEY